MTARLLVRDLLPGVEYDVQVRQVTADLQSEWSYTQGITTLQDTTLPNPPTAVTWLSEGRSFLASWTAPTTTTDGLPLFNLAGYEVRISFTDNTSTVRTVVYKTTSTRFDFTYEMNEAVFGSYTNSAGISKTAKSPLKLEVRAYTNTPNYSSWAVPTPNPAFNPVPISVALTVVPSVEQNVLSWNQSTDTDLVGYNVYAATSAIAGTKIGFVNGLNFVHNITSGTWYYNVRPVDIFGQESGYTISAGYAPKSPILVDTTPPAVPTGVTTAVGFDTTRQEAYITVSWTASVSTDLRNYTIRYAPTAASNWNYVTVNSDVTTARIDVTPGQNYYVAVQAIDFVGNKSAFVNSATYPHAVPTDTSTPPTPAIPTAAVGTMMVQVSHSNLDNAGTPAAMPSNVIGYEVHASKTSGFTTYNSTTLIGKLTRGNVTSDTFYLPATGAIGAAPDKWYIKVRAFNRVGTIGPASAQVEATPNLIANANITDATITTAKIVSLEAGKITADSAIIANITVGRTTDANGSLSSFGYVAGTAGWKIDKTGMEIVDGTIKARAVELKSSPNLLPWIYSTLEAVPRLYTLPVTNAVATFDGTDLAANVGQTQALKVVTSNVANRVYLGSSTGDYNTPLEAGKTYIVSVYAKAITDTPTLTGYVKQSTAAEQSFTMVNAGTLAAQNLSSTYTRFTGKFTAAASVVSGLISFGISTSGTTYFVDAVQVEEKVGKLDNPNSFSPPSMTSVDGGVIKTGSVQSNITTTITLDVSGTPTATQVPLWYINTAGSAQFTDARVLGKLTIGGPNYAGPGSDQTTDGFGITRGNGASVIESFGYITGVSGWQINSNGIAEFVNGFFRGNITALSGDIAGSLNVSGTMTAGVAGAQRVTMSSAGVNAYNSSNVLKTTISASTGQLSATDGSFSGNITATGGSITGSLSVTGQIFSTSGSTTATMSNGYFALTDTVGGVSALLNAATMSSNASFSVTSGGTLVLDGAAALNTESTFDTNLVAGQNMRITGQNAVYINSGAGTNDTRGASFDFGAAGGFTVRTGGAFSTQTLYLGTDGTVQFPRHGTTTNPANIWISTGGTIGRVTSTRASKVDITPIGIDPKDILLVEPVMWKDREHVERFNNLESRTDMEESNLMPPNWIPGVVAEQLDDAGLSLFVTYDPQTGKPNGVMYDRLIAAVIPMLQNLNDRVNELEGVVE